MRNSPIALTYETFIEKADKEVKAGKNFSGVIAFSEKEAWFDFDDAITRFNSVRRRWKADIINTYQDDFLVLRFKDGLNEEGDKNFFIKVNDAGQYVNLLVFSFEGYVGFKIFKSLINKYTRKAWLGWLGSIFLERFDEIIKDVYPDSKAELVKFNYISHEIGSEKPKGTAISWMPTTKKGLFKLRESFKEQNQFIYLQKTTYEINTDHTNFSISLSDRTEFTLQRGNLIEFLAVLGEILKRAQQELVSFTKTRIIRKQESKIEIEEEPIEMVSFEIDKIEIIELDVDPITDWFQNLTETFRGGYLKEYNLISSIINEGNPYFLAKIIDLDNASIVFLSATKRSIRISPATEQTKPSTMSKLFTILQSQVDPSISTGGMKVAYPS